MAGSFNFISQIRDPVILQAVQPERNYLSCSQLMCGTVHVDNEHKSGKEFGNYGSGIVCPRDLTNHEQIARSGPSFSVPCGYFSVGIASMYQPRKINLL